MHRITKYWKLANEKDNKSKQKITKCKFFVHWFFFLYGLSLLIFLCALNAFFWFNRFNTTKCNSISNQSQPIYIKTSLVFFCLFVYPLFVYTLQFYILKVQVLLLLLLLLMMLWWISLSYFSVVGTFYLQYRAHSILHNKLCIKIKVCFI